MASMSIRDLAAVVGGRLTSLRPRIDAAETPVGRIVTDSREIEPGDVFWALKGPNHDGADFIREAFARGAKAAVAARSAEPGDAWLVEVEDSYEALRRLAEWKRQTFRGKVIAITGSVGKTTTRQMIHTVLGKRLRGVATSGNLNNHIGMPLTMTGMTPEHDYAVLELGANHKGEIAALAALCRPHIGVITRIGDAHLGMFGGRQGIVDAKAELLDALPPDGPVVLGDDPWLLALAQQRAQGALIAGECEGCHLKAEDVHSGQGRLRFRVEGQAFAVPVWGRHHLTAAMAAIAVGRLMGLEPAEIANALESYCPMPQRCEVLEVRGATIINDTYNASPTAMRAALQLLSEIDAPGRRIVVSGDMAELGDEAAALHWEFGQQAVALGGAELVIACGQYARCVVAGARAAGLPKNHAIPCETPDGALPYLGQAILPGDVALVKGSRMMAMERVIQALERFPRRRTA